MDPADLFNTFFNPQGMLSPALGSLMAKDPEAAAQVLAKSGMEPPASFDQRFGEMPLAAQGPGVPLPQARPPEAGADAFAAMGVPLPRPRPAEAPQAGMEAMAKGNPADAATRMLQGIKAPAAPVAQKPSTPSLPGAAAAPTAAINALVNLLQGSSQPNPLLLRLGQTVGR